MAPTSSLIALFAHRTQTQTLKRNPVFVLYNQVKFIIHCASTDLQPTFFFLTQLSATVSQQLLQIAKISSMYQTKTMHATQTNKGSKQTNKQVQQLSNNETDPHCHLCFDLRAPSSLQNPVQ